MIAAGLWIPRKQCAGKVHQPRNRCACLGELVQIDGSDHAWFEDRALACTLLVFIDDATSRLMQLHFVPTESASAYFEATRSYLEAHGKPSDHAIMLTRANATLHPSGTVQPSRADEALTQTLKAALAPVKVRVLIVAPGNALSMAEIGRI